MFEELFLHTHGFGENPRLVNQADLQKRLKISERQWRRTIEALERLGLVIRLKSLVRGRNSDRGTVIQVNLPGDEVTGPQPVTSGQPVTGPQPVHEREEEERKHEKAPSASASGLAAIVARILKVNQGNPESTREQIVMLALNEARRRGIEADEREAGRVYDQLTGETP